MLMRALQSWVTRSSSRLPQRLQRKAAQLASLRIGRRFDSRRGGLGLQQRWYAAQPTTRIVISVLELGAPTTREFVEIAVRGLCARHPEALGVCEERAQTRLCVRPLMATDAVPWFGDAQDQVWQLAAAMLHQPFAAGAPLFRIALSAERRHVIAAFDHLILDGISAGIFAAELGAFLAGDALLPPAANAGLPLDARLDIRPSLKVFARALGAGHVGGTLLLAPSPAPASSTGLRTQMFAQAFPRDLIDALVQEARWHSLTLHSVLSAAALLAALEVLEARSSKLRLTTPVSLRNQCRPVPDGLGVFVAGIETDLELSVLDDPWRIARRCRDDIARQRPEAHRSVGLLAFAGDLESLAARYERTANGRTSTVEVSNVGRIIGVPSGAAVWLTQGAHYHAALFVLTVATSDSDGALRCCLSYPEPIVDRALASRFMSSFERRLYEMRESSTRAVSAVDA
jgi:hypothetical protein